MKNINYLLSLCSIGLILACNNLSTKDKEVVLTTNLDGTITIEGKINIEGNEQPLKGLNTVNIANKWKNDNKQYNITGENERVFVDKKGYYRITIQKGDTIQFIPNSIIYKQALHHYKVFGLTKNSIVNFTVKIDSLPYQNGLLKFPEEIPFLDKFLNETDPEKLHIFSGTITNKETGQMIKKMPIYFNYHNSTNRSVVHHLTDEYGQFFVTIPHNTLVEISALNYPTRLQKFYITKDTVANILF